MRYRRHDAGRFTSLADISCFCIAQESVATSDSLTGSSKRNNADPMDVDSEPLESIKRRRVEDTQNIVQENATRAEIEERMVQFIASKREQINESNRQEFIKGRASGSGTGAGSSESQDGDDDGCARVDARKLNRTIQMKLETVKNEALTKTNPRSHTPNDTNITSIGLDERLRNIQVHLNLRIGRLPARNRVGCLAIQRCRLLIPQSGHS